MSILCRLHGGSLAVAPGLRKVTASVGERVVACSVASRLRSLLHDSDGNTLFETAIASIFMCTVLLGIFSISMALIAYQQLGYATMRATQDLANGRGIITDPCATAAADITASLPAWTTTNFTYTVTITSTVAQVDSTNSFTGTTCTSAATDLTNATLGTHGNPVILHVTYAYNWFPILRNISGTLAAETTMLVE